MTDDDAWWLSWAFTWYAVGLDHWVECRILELGQVRGSRYEEDASDRGRDRAIARQRRRARITASRP